MTRHGHAEASNGCLRNRMAGQCRVERVAAGDCGILVRSSGGTDRGGRCCWSSWRRILPGGETLSFDAARARRRRDGADQRVPVAARHPPRAATDDPHLRPGLAGLSAPARSRSRSTWSTARRPRSGTDLAIAFGLALVSMLVGAPARRRRRRASPARGAHAGATRTPAQPHRRARGDPVRDRRARRGRAARGDPRRARADDRALAGRRHPPDARLGVRPLLADRRQPGGAAARQQLGHARLPLVREGVGAHDGLQPSRATRPRSSGGARPATGCSPPAARAAGNMFSGDAPRCTATMSVIRDRSRSQAGGPLRLLRRSLRVPAHDRRCRLADIAGERRAARRQRRSGAEHVDRGGALPADPRRDHGRHARPQRRDADGATSSRACPSATRPSSATTRSPTTRASASPTRSRCCRQPRRQLARLERAIEQAPRPYHLVVLSDHGQTQGAPFRQRYGETLEEVVRGALDRRRGARAGRASTRRGATSARVLADAREEPSVGRPRCSRAPRAAASVEGDRRARARTARRSPSATRRAAAARAGGGRAGVRRPRARLPAAEQGAAHARARSSGATRGWSRRSPRIPGSAS